MTATGLAHCPQIVINLAVAIHTPTFKPRRPDHQQQSLVFMMSLAMRNTPLCVVTADVNIQNLAESAHGVLSRMPLDKRVLQPDSLAKYTSAFFKISRSSVSRFTSARSRRISAASLASCCRCSADLS